jgi:hypothetical protein
MAKPEPAMSSSRRSGSVSLNSLRNPGLVREIRCPASPVCMVTPHVAWASNQSIEEFRQQLVENLEGFAAGTPRNVIIALDGNKRNA